jgi:hypothetical protein
VEGLLMAASSNWLEIERTHTCNVMALKPSCFEIARSDSVSSVSWTFSYKPAPVFRAMDEQRLARYQPHRNGPKAPVLVAVGVRCVRRVNRVMLEMRSTCSDV